MKRTIVIAAVMGLAANAFAFQSSEVSQVLKAQLNGTVHAPISQMGTADFANATWGGAKDLASATGADASAAGKVVAGAASKAGGATADVATAAGNKTADVATAAGNKTADVATAAGNGTADAATATKDGVSDVASATGDLATNVWDSELVVSTRDGLVVAGDWISALPGSVAIGVTNVYYGVVDGVSATANGVSADGKAVSQTAISQSNIAQTVQGSKDSASFDSTGDSASASADFSSAPLQISKVKKVRPAAQAARRAINSYGADSRQAQAAILKLGEFAAAEAGVVLESADQAYATGVLFVSAVNM